MITVLKELLAGAGSFLPNNVVQDAGASTALTVLVLFVFLIFWQAVLKDVVDALLAWIKKHSLALVLFVLTLPVLASLTAKSYRTALFLALTALCLFLVYRRGKPRWRIRWLAALQILLMVAGVVLEGRLTEHEASAKNDRLQVYVVLPFEPLRGEPREAFLSLSGALRNKLNDVFGDLVKEKKVQVVPEQFLDSKDLSNYREPVVVVERFRKEGLDPDLVLVNRASLRKKDGDFLVFSIEVCTYPEEKTLKFIRKSGPQAHFPYLVLQASLEMLEEVGRSKSLEVSQAEQEQIKRGILAEYMKLLDDDDAPEPMMEEAQCVSKMPGSLPYSGLAALLRQIPKEEDESSKDALEARVGGNLVKVAAPFLDEKGGTAASPAPKEGTL